MAINPAIRSRCHLFAIKPLETADIIAALNRAAASEKKGLNGQVQLDPKAAELIASYCGGDIRYALNVLELCAIASDEPVISPELVRQYVQRPVRESTRTATDITTPSARFRKQSAAAMWTLPYIIWLV